MRFVVLAPRPLTGPHKNKCQLVVLASISLRVDQAEPGAMFGCLAHPRRTTSCKEAASVFTRSVGCATIAQPSSRISPGISVTALSHFQGKFFNDFSRTRACGTRKEVSIRGVPKYEKARPPKLRCYCLKTASGLAPQRHLPTQLL
jgi:hypothetical protein